MAAKRTSKPTSPIVHTTDPNMARVVKPTDGSLSTANFEEGFTKPCSVCTRLWVAGVQFIPEQHPELCRQCEKYPRNTPYVLKAVADLMEPTGEVPHKEIPGNEMRDLFREEMDAARGEILSDLAKANAFFERNGNLRVHGNFTINELYEAFKARMNYEIEL